MDFSHLLDYAKSLEFETGAGPLVTDAKFFGGNDIRTEQVGFPSKAMVQLESEPFLQQNSTLVISVQTNFFSSKLV